MACSMTKLKLKVMQETFAIHSLPADSDIPARVHQSRFFAVVRTDDELSVVCSSDIDPGASKNSTGWSCLKVAGLLDLSLTGILAGISAVLSRAGISIFVISTYETDYILVETSKLARAKQALAAADYTLTE